jgi:hypothetical protein
MYTQKDLNNCPQINVTRFPMTKTSGTQRAKK